MPAVVLYRHRLSRDPIERGLAGPELLAQVLVSKYADHLPLYHQSQIFTREGVELNPSTLDDWVTQTGNLLTPLVAALQHHVLAGNTLHADDTPLPVLAPGNGKNENRAILDLCARRKPARQSCAAGQL